VPYIRDLFKLNELSYAAIATCAVVALVSVLWIELWKLIKRNSSNIQE